MAQFVTHIQPTLVEASQGHIPFHHGHQVGHQHQSHLPHSGHNMPSPPIHNSHPHQQHHTAQTHNKSQNSQHSKNHHYKNYPTGYNMGDGNTSFLRSARAGNLEKVLEHLKNNIDINTCNTNGLNALHLASKDGHVHVVSELLKRGAIVDSATKKGNTALHIASLAGQEEVVALLLKSSAAVNVQSQNGFTPLYMAAQENHDSVVRLLLANGANQSLATEDGFTPLAVAMQQGHDKVVAVLLESDTRGKVRLPALHIAAKKDDVKAATLLLENEHNPDITSKSGFTPLHIASHYGNQSIANLLIQKGADVNFLAKHNISPLHVAAKWGKTNMVSLLLEKGAYIEAKTRDGLTPLHCAARSGHEQVVDMLLERGAPISAKTKNGLAPLHMAAQGEHVDAARILLYHRAPVDEVTVDYLTALHVAAHCGHVRVAKLLVDRNADANARALNGFTPLHIACKKNRIKVVELLLRHGASISATTESGLTPLHVAAFMGCMNIVIYLLQHDASPDVPTVRGETPLHLAARANQTDIIRILLRNGAQVDARAREQQTPLHIASRLGNVDIVMLLLQHGAQVDATTKDMYTALHIAAKEGQDEVSAVLIENGASLEFATKKGFTPLHLAAKYGHMKVAQLLLQKDANVDAQGKNGVTPLHVACHYDNQNVALLLLERGASPHAPAKNGHTPLHIAARKNQMDIATTLLEYGANADTESKAGFTPLHLSSQEGHSELSSLLIEHNANVNHVAKNGLTPMHLCAQEDNVNVAEVIFKNGANVDMVTKAGYTPLHVASHFGQSNMVRFLLQKSANVDADTAIGYTPLHQAAQQGHCHIVNVLLEHKANANAQTANGQTPLHIAKRLGYISVLDSLKSITNVDDQNIEAKELLADKYRVVAPEAMHETFMSDSEEEGGEDNALTDQPYRYLTVDEMKSLGDDSLPFDVTRDERMDSNRMTQSIENTPRQAVEETVSPHRAQMQHTMKSTFDGASWNIPDQEFTHIGRKLQWKNFLVSFLVDARGGAMRGCRHSGVKMIVPSRSTCQPTRITCRYVKPQRTMHPPQLMEGEALASRVLELGPVSVKFQGPVVMEIPHFASLRGKEREIIILRSDNGETWREHSIDNVEDITQEVYAECFEPEEIKQLNEQSGNHVCRFITYDFPQYFAVVSRIRQEVHAIGSEGGMVTSTVVPQVQAVFPQGALTKKIKVGLQAQPVDPDLTAKLLGRGVAVSPIVTVEPRRRKFHKAITLSMPAPKAHSQGMINQYSGNAPTLRLLCSITGGASRAQWEDVTGSTPLTFVNDCVSFTTTVSARFWLMDCRNISESTKMATDLYREVIHVPFMAKFVVFAKRVESNEAKLRVFCMTDDREDKTLEKQELFSEVAKSRNVEVLEGKPQYIEMAGNLVPVTKSGEQLQLIFKAFRENRLPFSVRVKDQHADIVGRTLFMKEPKIAKGEPPQHPICILNIILPEIVIPDQTQHVQDKYEVVCSQYSNSHFIGDLRIADVSNLLGKDYILLAPEIGISQSEINVIVNRYPNSIARQAQDLIRLFKEKPHYDINVLEHALKMIGREDIFQKCRPIHEDNKTEEKSNAVEYGKNTNMQRIHDREEIKYSAEEKEVEESESDDDNEKRTVAERREKIVKRLSVERQIPASSQKREIVQEITEIKRTSLIDDKKAIHEEEIMLQMPIDNVIKSFAPENVVKMKLNKFETIETSIADFEKELHFKFKTSVRNDKSDRISDSSLKKQSNGEEVSKTNKFNTNEEIRKSSQHNIETKPCLDNLILNKIKTESQLQETDFHSVNIKEETEEIKTTLEKRSDIEKPLEEFKKEQVPDLETISSEIKKRSIDLSDKTKDIANLLVKAAEKSDDHEEPNHLKEIPNLIMKAEEERKNDDDDQEEKLPEGTEAKGTIKAVKNEEYTTEQPKVNAASEAHEMDIIRKEASVLIKDVLEESVTILNNRQQTNTEVICENQKSDEQISISKHHEFLQTCVTSESMSDIPYDDNSNSEKKSTSPLEKDGAISPDTKEIPPTIISVREQKVEKKFQKISLDVDNIDKSVESFDQTFNSFVNEDEISSLHQEFSKISWNESISTTTSTIADIEQNTPDTDNQDLLTDTGGENIQRDISEEMLHVAPCPTPRTCLENLDRSEGNKELIKPEELTHHENHTKDFPVPQPRQMKNVLSPTTQISSKNDDFIESIISIHETGMVPDVKEEILNIKEDKALFKEVKADDDINDQCLVKTSDFSIKPLITQHEGNDRLSPTKLSDFDNIDPLEIRDSITPGLSKGLPEMSLSPKQVTFEDTLLADSLLLEQTDSTGEDFGKTENIRLEKTPSLSGIHEYTTPIDMDSFEDRKGEIEDNKDNDEPQPSFYIGESSRNVIIKSKSSQYDDEEECSHDDILKDVVDENEKILEEGTKEDKSIASELLECHYIPIEKVVRQGSETRNDILEIENELEKPSMQVEKDHLNETLSHISTESKVIESSDDGTFISSTKELIETGQQDQDVHFNKTEQEVTNKTSKLDLLLEKSELELSEKLCTIPTVKKLSDMIENYKADTSLPDQLLVERTLEEVELSLDAAKEELIQVVRDGKGIKESPSEFEFKNISHTNLNIDQGDAKCKSLIAPTVLDDIEEASDLHDFMDKIDKGSEIVSSGKLTECTDTPADKPVSPVSNKCSFHEVDNSSSSESNYKNISRPCSSDFDTVQTFHTSSEYQTAMDVSTFRGSTEYVSAVSTLESSGKTLSSRESMKSLSSEASGNLGSIDTSELSETLIASIADHDIQIELEHEDLEALEIDNNVPYKEDINSRSIEYESPQTCMKRSQEMIFNKDESVPEIPTTIEQKLEENNDECFHSEDNQLAPSKTITLQEDNTGPSNFENLVESEGPSSLSEIEALASLNLDETVDLNDLMIQIPQNEILSPDKLSNTDEPRRRGHKRHESTSVSNEAVKNLLEEEAENTSIEDIKNKTAASSNLSEDDFKGSESESDHDPYESEYSRAFKSPTQRKKKKRENKQVDALEDGQESVLSPLHLAEQTIIEDVFTEELESQITTEDERRPSQNLQDYSIIPDITVTEEISQRTEESDDFPDNTLYKVKTQDELNKVEDTPIPRTTEAALSKSEEEFNVLIEQQYKQKLADLNESDDFEKRAPDSPDSFEMVDQPDITDEFVIIEEVAKEANEFDVEGKSIKISSSKIVKKHDEEVEQILIKSAPAATNLGSQIFRDDLNFEFEESPPSLQAELDTESADISGNKKWVEMQLSDHAAQLRYPYELERGVLEDIKEEDAEFEIGSSRISSFKDSFSSTPDYDILAGRKYFSKAENDNISMSSLQEFESLEQAISLENRRIHQGSTDSSNGSFTRRYTIKNAAGDDISFSSLKEFEGLENACIEAHLIEIKAKEEAALLLSRSDESNKSNNGKENTEIVVVSKQITNTIQSIPKETVESILKSKLEECEDSKISSMETSNTFQSESVTTVIKSKLGDCEDSKVVLMKTSNTFQSIPKESVAAILKSKHEQCEDSKGTLMETSNTFQSIPKESVTTILRSRLEECEDFKDSLMETSNTVQSIPKESIEAILKSKLEECEDSKVSLMETSLDSIDIELEASRNKFGYNVSEHESADSLEINKSVELVTSSIDSFDISKEITTKSDVDSLEPISCREGSVDSIEIEQIAQLSLYGNDPKYVADIPAQEAENQGSNSKITETVTTTTSISVQQSSVRVSMDMSNDSLNLCFDPSSSAATNATYFNEGDSLMSDSMASCASSTLIEDSAFPNTSQSFVLHSHTEKVYFEDKSIPDNSKTVDDSSKEADTKP